MGFAALKKRSSSKKNVQQMMDKLGASSGGQQSYIDDRYWKLDRDKSGNGMAVIRFLDAPEGEDFPFVKIYSHGFKGPGGWYIENSLTTIGQDDPVSEANSELWNSGLESNKDIARARKRRMQYVSNIYVVKDSNNPQNEGKVMLFKYGKSIFDMIQSAGTPEFEDDVPVNVFDMWKGADFKLKARKADGFIKYDRSGFNEPSQWLETDVEMETLYAGFYSLSGEVAPDKFKTYDELATKFAKVTGGNVTTAASMSAPTAGASASASQEAEVPWKSDAEINANGGTVVAEEDDTMSYFAKLANSD